MRHGGDLADAMAAFGGAAAEWLDLSTGINPHPWPVPDDLRRTGWERLPSRADLDRLLAAARHHYGVPDELAIVAAPGTQSLIQWLPRLAAPGPVAILGPTYAEHEAAWTSAGFETRTVTDLRGASEPARHVVLVSPNNPDGRVTAESDILAAAERCRSPGAARGRDR